MFLKKIRVSEGINLKFVLTKFGGIFLKHRVSEIRVKRIRVNRGVSVLLSTYVLDVPTFYLNRPQLETLVVTRKVLENDLKLAHFVLVLKYLT